MIRYGSVCSGIEAASVAWDQLGWQPAWFSEIEPFPSAVLAHHWPHIPNIGDMTTIATGIHHGLISPDILVGGTPCQAFSVAGLRNGLDDARGQLTLSYVELANAIDDKRRERGEQPAIIVWENVPGVLNTKDNAFGCFLAGLAGESSELQPAGKKWTNAGCVYGPQRAVAWRTLDAQFFGVAQRRRRVFVIASAREGFDPATVLFEFDSVRRNTPPCREEGENVAALTANGVGTCGADDNQGQAGHLIPQKAFRMTAFGEYADDETASTCKTRDYKDATDLAVTLAFPERMSATQAATTENLAPALMSRNPTLRAGNSNSSNPNGGKPPAICIQHATIGRKDEAGPQGKGYQEGVAFTQDSRSSADVVQYGMQVRRLTPRECERLQGFPDDHTLIEYGRRINPEKMDRDFAKYLMRGGKLTFEECCGRAADGPRYKAIGNSMAVPVMRWLGEQIARAIA